MVIANNSVVIFKLRKDGKESVGQIRDMIFMNGGLRYKLYIKSDGWFLNGENLNEAFSNLSSWRKKKKNQWVFKCWVKPDRIIKIIN